MSEQRNSNKDQKGLISLEVFSNTHAVIFEDIQTLHEEESGRKIYSESNRDITSDVRPATDPGSDATTPGRRQGKGLIVDAAGSGEDGSYLS